MLDLTVAAVKSRWRRARLALARQVVAVDSSYGAHREPLD